MLKHFFGILIHENLRGFLLVAATTAGLAIQGLRADSFQLLSVVPISFAALYLILHLHSVFKLARQTYHSVPIPYSLCLGQTRDCPGKRRTSTADGESRTCINKKALGNRGFYNCNCLVLSVVCEESCRRESERPTLQGCG